MSSGAPLGVPIQYLTALALSVCLAAEPVASQEYQIDLGKENRVRFISDAPLEDFEGVTDRIDGFLSFSGEGLSGETDLSASEFYFEVDLASLDTGIGLRNRHMRERYLETGEFPYASFSGRVARLVADSTGAYLAVTRGVFSVHGIERERDIECRAEMVGQDLRVRCAFQVLLSDHDIPIPKLMFMKIDEVMELDLDLFLSPAGGGEGR
jgi:polyisoprenoid-binding protein YceI